MQLPWELFLKSIEQRKVYLFSTKQIRTDQPHYFICLKKSDNNFIIMSCCTSQFDTINKLIQLKKYNPETFVWISPKDVENPFTKDTYVNCNNAFVFSLDELKQKYESGSFVNKGAVSEVVYEQIILGTKSSKQVSMEIKIELGDN